jgi:hypothetical protein
VSKARIISRAPAAIAVVLALALGAQAAFGAEQTRESYTAKVEPICKVNTEASNRILKGVKSEVKSGKLKVASGQFAQAAKALKKTLTQLKAVPQPSADKAKLTKWLGYIKEEVELFEQTSAKLKAGDKGGAESLTVKITRAVNLANNQVLAFDFKYCHVESSQFT